MFEDFAGALVCLRQSRTAKLSISGGEKSSNILQTELATKGKETENGQNSSYETIYLYGIENGFMSFENN